MKRIRFILFIVFISPVVVQAQNCTTGYCPETLFVHHKAGDVSPKDADITYEITEVILGASDTTCWIARNLGATELPSSTTDYTLETVGWYFQFNRKQGYYWNGTNREPNVFNWQMVISEATGSWEAENDPCTLLLGSNWSVPSNTDFDNLLDAFGLTATDSAYVEGLNFIADGGMVLSGGINFTLHHYVWTSDIVDDDSAMCRRFSDDASVSQGGTKQSARNVRCVRSYR